MTLNLLTGWFLTVFISLVNCLHYYYKDNGCICSVIERKTVRNFPLKPSLANLTAFIQTKLQLTQKLHQTQNLVLHTIIKIKIHIYQKVCYGKDMGHSIKSTQFRGKIFITITNSSKFFLSCWVSIESDTWNFTFLCPLIAEIQFSSKFLSLIFTKMHITPDLIKVESSFLCTLSS